MSLRSFLRRLIGRSPAGPEQPDVAAYRSMVEQSADLIGHVVNGHFTYVSPSARALFGWEPETLIGTTGLELIHEPDLPILEDVIARTAAGDLGLVRHQLRVVCGDGSLKWAETTARSERLPNGDTRVVLVIRDISETKHLEAQLETLALKDGLTGIANRRTFDETLERTWRQTLRQGGEMALLLMDIDFFKRFNDAYGHQAGDDCLRTVAQVIASFARRPADLACRYGGEEFTVIMGETSAQTALLRAEEIRAAVETLDVPHEGGLNQKVTISIGVATAVSRIGGSVRMPETLLQAADHALYKAKEGGRNRVEQSVLIAPSGRES